MVSQYPDPCDRCLHNADAHAGKKGCRVIMHTERGDILCPCPDLVYKEDLT